MSTPTSGKSPEFAKPWALSIAAAALNMKTCAIGSRAGKRLTKRVDLEDNLGAEAIDDLAALRAQISRDNPAAARRVALHLLEMIGTPLAENPPIGRPGRVPGTREFVIDKTPYIVPYRVKETRFRYCASIMGRVAGRSRCEVSLRLPKGGGSSV
ncbi:Plasmid stabilization system protein, RelE/ParE family [Methylocystis sp. SC2]|nr:Plasmid stabilization system protein, RelE/ParE family [Methylocystis sp. SC2]